MNTGYFAVAVLDVLGQKAEFERLARYPVTDTDRENARSIIAKTFGTVSKLRQCFPKAFERWNTLELVGASREKSEVRSYSFADTVVAYALVQREPTGVFGTMGLIVTCALAYLRCLAQGIPIRGGIDVGWAGELEGESADIYGPVLISAHKLESGVAEWPRVVVGQGAMSYLRALEADRDETTRAIAQRCSNDIVKDVDGIHIVDCLGPNARALLDGPDFDMKEEAAKVVSFLNSEHTRLRASGNAKLAARYALSVAHFAEAFLRLNWEIR